jgi:PAS domain S-box-containing protein
LRDLIVNVNYGQKRPILHFFLYIISLIFFLGYTTVMNSAGPFSETEHLLEQLRLSEKRLKEAQRLARLGSWELNLVTNTLVWSDEVFRIFEVRPDEFEATFEAFLALVHPDDQELLREGYLESLKEQRSYLLIHRILLPDGRMKYVEERGEHEFDTDGNAIRSIGTVQDMTETYLYEERLREMNFNLMASKSEIKAKEERFKQIADSTQTVIWEVNADGLYTYVNQIAETVWGYKPDDIVGKFHFFDLHPENGREEFRLNTLAIFEKKSIIKDFANDVERADGVVITVITSGQPVLGSDGELLGYRGSDIDITDRLRAQSELRRSLDMLNKLAAHVPGVLYQFQVFSDGRSCFPYASERIQEMYGLTTEQVRNDSSVVFALYHPDDIKRIMFEIAHSAENLSLLQVEYRVKIPGRVEEWHLATAMPERLPDGSTMWHGIATNIDERKQLETVLRSNDRELRNLLKVREEQNKRLLNFTHIVSHNLRSHTSNLQGLMSLIEMDEPELFSHEYLKMVDTSSKLLSETISYLNQVLDIRLNTDQLLETVSLNEVIYRVVSALQFIALDAGVKLHVEISDFVNVRGVKSYLENILHCLIENAIKFRSPDRSACVHVSVTAEGSRVRVRVQDNGLGINLERHGAKLFGMYKTFHSVEGSKGLGLFIAKNQIDAMGGKIDVRSEVDAGSVFTMSLPKA